VTNITSPEQAFSESLQNLPKTLVSPSSFYTSLEVLEKKGLVLFNRNRKGKVVTVEKTELTDNFIETIHQYFLFNMVNEGELNNHLFKKLTEILESQQLKKDNIISVFPFDTLNFELIKHLMQNYRNIYVLGSEKIKERLLSLEKFIFSFSKVKNGQIREPDNDFDVSIIQIYSQNCDFYDLSFDQILSELIRITKPNGIICIYALKELGILDAPFIPNILIRDIFTLYNKSIRNNGICFTKSHISDVLLKERLTNLQIIEDEGILIGLGKKK
jgi:hypothetical protein